MLKTYILLYLANMILGATGAGLIAKYGARWELLDKPNYRSSHDKPTPKGGGIGIVAGFCFASLFLNMPLIFWMPASILSLISLWGDIKEFSPKIRLPVQFMAALLSIQFSELSFPPSIFWLVLSSIFIVGTTNCYNFMDGINGISAITGIVGFGLIAIFSIISDCEPAFTIMAVSVQIACLGFLPFNLPKSKVFMGDVGSILLGFAFAQMAILLSKDFLDFVCLASFLFPFYADELSTMAIRIRDGENLLRPHRRHLYQLMANEGGISHWKISLTYGALQFAIGLSILLMKNLGLLLVLSVLAAYFSSFLLFSFFKRRNFAASV